jgi:hypothetical protein
MNSITDAARIETSDRLRIETAFSDFPDDNIARSLDCVLGDQG